MAVRVLAVVVLLALGGCAQHRVYSPAELRAELGRVSPDLANVVVPFEVAPSQIELARRMVGHLPLASLKATALINALSSPTGFGLEYRNALTVTGAQALRQRGGNCLSLASALVGLARGLGLNAFYVDVTGNLETLYQDDVSVRVGHITAVIVAEAGFVSLDVAGLTPTTRGYWRVISDLEAVAHFYNNRGYELIYEAESEGRRVPWAEVAVAFDVATRVDPAMARAWNNLGVALTRVQQPERSVQAFSQAIAAESAFAAPRINLAKLLMRQGDLDAAETVLNQAEALNLAYADVRLLRRQLDQKRHAGR
jgi:tetratricopeptide (TPR) repeat protein